MAVRGIIDGEFIAPCVDGDIEPALAGINTGTDYGILAHLRRTLPLMRTRSSFNHAGQMKNRSRSCYEEQPLQAAVGIDPTTGGPAWVAAQVGPFLAERRPHNFD